MDTANESESRQMSDRFKLRITVLRVHGLLKGRRPRKFYVSVAIDRNTQTTATIKGDGTIEWNESLVFDASKASSFHLQVYESHNSLPALRNRCIGSIKEDRIEGLLDDPNASDLRRDLFTENFKGESQASSTGITIELRLQVENDGNQNPMDGGTRDVVSTVTAVPEALAHVLGPMETAVNDISSSKDIWGPLLEKVKLFSDVVDKIAEIHPYAKMAWSVLSAAHKAILAQSERDKGIQDLVVLVDDIYAFITEADSLTKIESHKAILARMAQQTVECGYFITSYAQDKSFGIRLVKNTISKTDDAIGRYKEAFTQLKKDFQFRSALHTEITVHRVAANLEHVVEGMDLNDMCYAGGASFDSEKQCLPGTRITALDEITEWINRPNDEHRIYLLHGAAGTGKSAIAHTVAGRFKELARLGSSFCCDRTFQSSRGVNNMFSTIARDLADREPQIRHVLWQAIHDDKALRTTLDPRKQLENFILNPTKKLEMEIVGPIVIVIDALDESGDTDKRQLLLDLLAQRVPELPTNFRIVITSRPEADILEALDGRPHVFSRSMGEFDSSTTEDIIKYIKDAKSQKKKLGFINETKMKLLAEKSEGLFQRVSTVCKEIALSTPGLTPEELFVSFTSSASKGRPLDALYQQILERNFPPDPSNPDSVVEEFGVVMGQIMTAFEPLSIISLAEMRRHCDSKSEGDRGKCEKKVLSIVEYLGSLLSGVTEASKSVQIRPFHTSFRDFLTDRRRSTRFCIDKSNQHPKLALASLRIMKELRYNICGLETTSLRNRDIPNLPALIDEHIPHHLSYACRFWVRHLEATERALETSLQEGVNHFIRHLLLHWLEALSLIGAPHISASALLYVANWCMSFDQEMAKYVLDGRRFVRAFATPISQSALHVYLSALSFAPRMSLIRNLYLSEHATHAIALHTGAHSNWKNLELVLQAKGGFKCSTFSPDGRQIVSGSNDKTIRIWNAETGDTIGEPLRGHSHAVTSVAFSPDGQRIVSGSRDETIRIWNAETGDTIGEPLRGHSDVVNSVVFSPDGQQVVSGSEDQTIRIWNAETGDAIGEPLRGHSSGVDSVAFSPDGQHIVSGSEDQTIRIWNAETGDAIGEPLCGHSHAVTSVAFSPDGQRIVSGSEDQTIRIWNAETGDAIGEPLCGHSNNVTSVAFSPDGQRIVSGSEDQTIRIWNAETGDAIGEPLRGHSHAVTSVAFSPDGQRIVSGSYDETIRIWNAEAGDAIGEPLRGHSSVISSVLFSPDGQQIVSGSYDQTIRIWNAETGDTIGEPLRGHSNNVTSVAFSPDGQRIMSGSEDQTIRIWNAETGDAIGEPLRGHSSVVNSVAFSPDGQRIVSGSEDQTIRIWNGETGDAIGEPLRGHLGHVGSVAFSPDGQRIVSGSNNQTIRILNAETGEAIGEPLRGHSDYVGSVAFSPDGQRIVSGSYDKTIRIWNGETGDAIGEPLRGHSNNVTSVAFSPDGQRIVSGSYDQTIRIWNAETGDAIGKPLRGHSHAVRSVAFSPDGQRIVSGSYDQKIRIWNAETGDTIGEPLRGHSDVVNSVVFSPDGQQVVSGSEDQTIRIWNAETGDAIGEPLHSHSSSVYSVAFSPDGQRILSRSYNQAIRIWNAETGDAIGEPHHGHSDSVDSVAFSPDGRRIVSSSYNESIRIWNAETGDAIGEPLRGHSDSAGSVAFSPDGQQIVSGSNDKTIQIWNAETGDAIGEPLCGHSYAVTSVSFSPDGQRIVSGSNDKTIRIWNAETGDAIGEPLRGHSSVVNSVAFSPDGQRIVSGSHDETIRIWNADGGDTITEPRFRRNGHVWCNAFSPDGNSLSPHARLSEDGWIVGPQDELLFWAPHDLHVALPWPSLQMTLGHKLITVEIPDCA